MSELLNRYQSVAEELVKTNFRIRDEYNAFSKAMEDFMSTLIKQRFPEIKNFTCVYYVSEATFGCDWDGGPSSNEVNQFLDEMAKQYKLTKS